jgi:outer membrane protein
VSRIACLATAAAALFITAAPAMAQDASQPAQADDIATALGGDSLTIGVVGAYLPDYEGSNNYRVTGAPAAIGSFKGFSFSVLGNRASVDLIPEKRGSVWDFEAGPIGVVNFNRSSRSSIDDFRVKRLAERDTAIELGGYLGIGKTGVITSPYDKLSVSVSYRHSVSGEDLGSTWQPSINYLTPLSRKAAVALFASAQHVDREQSVAYFDITPGDSVLTGLPTFAGRAGWKNYTLGGAMTYSLTGNLLHGVKLIAGGTYSRLLNSYSYSPLVRIAGSPNQWIGAAGLAYTF